MPQATDKSTRPADMFEFGRNWQRYVADHLDPGRLELAAQSLGELLQVPLEDKVFLDIGAGSGIFSLCAVRAGARVISVDVDPESVQSCLALRGSEGFDDDRWRVIDGSILDPSLVASLEPADIVYSWGVLHHTGSMWDAIENAARLLKPGGLFAIAIYNTVSGGLMDSDRWATVKRWYNTSGSVRRGALLAAWYALWAARLVRAGRNPVKVAREYRSSRGMALQTDMIDWLGGYPYEHATADEIIRFGTERLGLELVRRRLVTDRDTGCNEFVFRRRVA